MSLRLWIEPSTSAGRTVRLAVPFWVIAIVLHAPQFLFQFADAILGARTSQSFTTRFIFSCTSGGMFVSIFTQFITGLCIKHHETIVAQTEQQAESFQSNTAIGIGRFDY